MAKKARKTLDTSFAFGANLSRPHKGGGQRGGKVTDDTPGSGKKENKSR